MKKNRIYIDTNVLICDFFFRNGTYKQGEKSSKVLSYLFAKPESSQLFIASFAIAQFVSTLSNRKITLNKIIMETNRLLTKFSVVDFCQSDITQSIVNIQNFQQTKDLEDQMQFDLCRKMKCNYIITNNYRDFKDFADISVLQPQKYRAIEFLKR
jgi:predicted nucleic acid-binding protein